MRGSLKTKLRRAWFKLLLSSPGGFGWYDVYSNNGYQGTVLAFGTVHAIQQTAQQDTYLRDAEGFATALNPKWSASLSYAPGSERVRRNTPAFRPAFLGVPA